jgi:hypothetical protein
MRTSRLGERVVLGRKHAFESDVPLGCRGTELQSAIRGQQPDLREVVLEIARDESGHVLQRF